MKDVTRYVDVLIAGWWRRRKFSGLRKGDLFRLYEEDGCPAENLLVNEALGTVFKSGQTLGVRSRPAGRRR